MGIGRWNVPFRKLGELNKFKVIFHKHPRLDVEEVVTFFFFGHTDILLMEEIRLTT